MPMTLAKLGTLLKQTMGLDVASVGPTTVARAAKARMLACNIKDLDTYWEHLQGSPTETQELIEQVVIPETWFLRDRPAFVAMGRMIHERSRTQRQDFRLLSLPCSTGEEPYSMAMTLLDAGLGPEQFHIDAIDISARALAHAERAIYGKNSFRGNELHFRDQHFRPTLDGYQVVERVRQSVCFRQGNLLDDHVLPGKDIYHIIFCRNILIYLDATGRERTIDLLARLLTGDGCLFVGPSEAGLLLDRKFVSTRIPMTFAFRKANGTARPPRNDMARPPLPAASLLTPASIPGPNRRLDAGPAPRPAPGFAAAPCFAPFSAPFSAPGASHPARANVAPDQSFAIEDIRRMADQGRLAEAMRHCEQQLREREPSPEALHLLGLISDAAGDMPAAAEYYRKALYLDPTHQQALAHLSLLLEKQGDSTGAKVLSARARRLNGREVKHHG
jgi:chemotaxis protein methyltransferase WspC